jgi:hypothetical protein
MTKKHPDAAEVQQDESVAEPQSPVADESTGTCDTNGARFQVWAPVPYGEGIPDENDMEAVASLLTEGAAAHLDQDQLKLLRRMVEVYARQFKGVAEA